MRQRTRVTAVVLLAAAMMCIGPKANAASDECNLLTAQNGSGQLNGWAYFSDDSNTKTSDVWSLTDGVLICKGTPKGYIYTVKDYTDFVLKLQWRWPPGKKSEKPSNGGVLIRMTGQHKIWPKSLEAQINAGSAGDFWGLDGYSLEGPPDRSKALEHQQFGKLINVTKMKAVEKPAGEWNQYEIVAKRGTVTLKINGELVNTATNCDTTPGKICLTAEGDEIHFRQIQLTTK